MPVLTLVAAGAPRRHPPPAVPDAPSSLLRPGRATPPPSSCSPPASAFVIMLGGIDLVDPVHGLARQRDRGAHHHPAGLRRLRRSPWARAAWPAWPPASPMSACASPPSSPRWPSAACSPAPRWSSRRSARSRWSRTSAPTSPGSPAAASASRTRCCIGARRPRSCAHLLQSRTRFGRYSAAIGAGEAAAYASGVKVDRQKVIALRPSPAASRRWPA